MNQSEFKEKIIKEKFGIDELLGEIYSFVDFGNVDYWYENDIRDGEDVLLEKNEKMVIDLNGLRDFNQNFSKKVKVYFGLDNTNSKSFGFINAMRKVFGRHNVITKNIQLVKHYLKGDDHSTRELKTDGNGAFIEIPKCNFDVEICIDAIRLCDKFDTFCLYSSDADFTGLARYLKDIKRKKFILIKGGFALHDLVELADIIINAQEIKQYIACKKQKSSQNG